MRIDNRQVPVAESRLDPPDLNAVLLELLAPVLEASRWDFQTRLDRETVPDARLRHLLPREERQVGSRTAFGVGVEQMVRAWVVLVHAPFDQMHTQNAGVEIHVLLRRSGNSSDMVQPVDRPGEIIAMHRVPPRVQV